MKTKSLNIEFIYGDLKCNLGVIQVGGEYNVLSFAEILFECVDKVCAAVVMGVSFLCFHYFR